MTKEQDDFLKKILSDSVEKTSAGFTASVMNKINQLPAKIYYTPLVPYHVLRYFLIAFLALVIAIPILCLVILLMHLQVFEGLQKIRIPNLNYGYMLISVAIFWLLFGINSLMEKKLGLAK